MSDKGAQFLEVEYGSGGCPVGPKLLGDIFAPAGYGVIFMASDGKFWKQMLAQNTDGSTYYDENNLPQLSLAQVAP